VPYKGGAPMMTDLIAGQIQMAIETSASSSQYVRSNRVRALAVTSPKPSPAFPGVPTMEEAGVPGYTFLTWFALMAPHGTPSAVEQKLSAALARALQSPDLKKRFEDQGVTPGNMSTAELTSFIKSETAKWGQLAKKAGITVD
jgi:tripartite-type tricarboxylate transporter receptor subunit TctC